LLIGSVAVAVGLQNWLGRLPTGQALARPVGLLLTLGVNLLVAVALLAVLPRLRISPRRLLPPASLVAAGLLLLSTLGRLYISQVQHNPAYAVVATAAGLLIFLYLFHQLVLLGAAWAATARSGRVVDLAFGSETAPGRPSPPAAACSGRARPGWRVRRGGGSGGGSPDRGIGREDPAGECLAATGAHRCAVLRRQAYRLVAAVDRADQSAARAGAGEPQHFRRGRFEPGQFAQTEPHPAAQRERVAVHGPGGLRVAALGLDGQRGPARRLRQPGPGARGAEPERRRGAGPGQRYPAAVPAQGLTVGAEEPGVLPDLVGQVEDLRQA